MRQITTVVLLAWAVAGGAGDFRGNTWGDTAEDVEAAEGAGEKGKTVYGLQMITYEVILGNYGGVTVCFDFTRDGKLAAGRYFAPEFGIAIFWDWEASLTRKYGEAEILDPFYTENEYALEKYYYEGGDRELEMGVVLGYFKLARRWETDSTVVVLYLNKAEYETVTEILYSSNEFFPQYVKDQREAAEQGF